MNKKPKSNAYEIFSRVVADMTSPVALSAFFFAFVCIRIIPDPVQALRVFFVCLITQSTLPILYLLIAYRVKIIPDVHLYKKEDRNKVLPAIAVFYLLGLMVLYKMSAPVLIIGIFLSSTVLVLIIWWVNRFYKISIHMSGIAGMLVGLFFVLEGQSAKHFMPFLPLAGWVRYRNKAHSFSELAVGAVTGMAVTWVIMAFFFA